MEGVPFRHLYTLGAEIECSLSIPKFNAVMGYKANNTIQGFGFYTGADAQKLLHAIGLPF